MVSHYMIVLRCGLKINFMDDLLEMNVGGKISYYGYGFVFISPNDFERGSENIAGLSQ